MSFLFGKKGEGRQDVPEATESSESSSSSYLEEGPSSIDTGSTTTPSQFLGRYSLFRSSSADTNDDSAKHNNPSAPRYGRTAVAAGNRYIAGRMQKLDAKHRPKRKME